MEHSFKNLGLIESIDILGKLFWISKELRSENDVGRIFWIIFKLSGEVLVDVLVKLIFF